MTDQKPTPEDVACIRQERDELRARYDAMPQTVWFREAHENKSLGDVQEAIEEGRRKGLLEAAAIYAPAVVALRRALGLLDCYAMTKRGHCEQDRKCPACLVHDDAVDALRALAEQAPKEEGAKVAKGG